MSTACVGGFAAGEIFRQFPDKTFMELSPDLITEPAILSPIMKRLENMTDRFVDAVGTSGRRKTKLPFEHHESVRESELVL